MGVLKEKRIDYLDTAKGIGIILVCIGHACTNQSAIDLCQQGNLIRFVTLFHMALFFFINGILYNEKYSQKPISGIVKKVKTYYIPFVIYNVIFWICHNFFSRAFLISGQLDPKDYAYHGMRSFSISFLKTVIGYRQRFAGAMWFLESLIVISIMFILTDYVATKWFSNKRILVLSVEIVTIVIANRLFNLIDIPLIPQSLTQMIYWGLNGLMFFYLGFLYKTFQWNDKIENHKYLIVTVVFIILCITVFFMRPKVVSVITNKSIPIYRYGIGAIIGNRDAEGLSLIMYILFAGVCFVGIIMTLLAAQWKGISKSNILMLLGRYSLHIMCLQFLAFKAVSLVIIEVYHLPIERLAEYPVIYDVNGAWWIAYTLSACFLPILLVKIYEYGKRNITRFIGHYAK